MLSEVFTTFRSWGGHLNLLGMCHCWSVALVSDELELPYAYTLKEGIDPKSLLTPIHKPIPRPQIDSDSDQCLYDSEPEARHSSSTQQDNAEAQPNNCKAPATASLNPLVCDGRRTLRLRRCVLQQKGKKRIRNFGLWSGGAWVEVLGAFKKPLTIKLNPCSGKC